MNDIADMSQGTGPWNQSSNDGDWFSVTRRSYVKLASTLPLTGVPRDSSALLEGTVSNFDEFDLQTDAQDPFIVAGAGIPYFKGSSGWEQVASTERADTILGLHLDKLDCHIGLPNPLPPISERVRGSTGQLRTFASQYDRSVSFQILYLIIAVDRFKRWYADLSPEDKWHGPSGTRAATVEDAAAKRLDGDPHGLDFAGVPHLQPSMHSPDVLDRKTEAAIAHLESGFTDFYLDNAGSPGWNVDFSEWAQEAFRNHLTSLPEDRLNELGIADPASFDILDHISNNNLGGGAIESPGVDAVLGEYILFHCEIHKHFLCEMTSRIREALPEREAEGRLNVTGNHGMLVWANTVYISDAFDSIFMETDHTLPPERTIDYLYKLGRAAGRFEKPVVALGNMIQIGEEVDTTAGLDPTGRYPTLLRLQVAEGYANGGIRTLPLTGWADVHIDNVVDNWIEADGTVADDLQSFIDFVWANRRFLEGGKPEHKVAIVYSLPTLLWRNRGPWYHRNEHRFALEGAAALCREHHIPYDIVLFGHGRLWDDEEQLQQLNRYEAVVLPAVESMSDEQVTRLVQLLDDGVTVVSSGPAPDRTAMFEPRDDVGNLLSNHENAEILESNPALERYEGGQSDGTLIESITASNRQVRLSTAKDIGVNIRVQSSRSRTIVHFVNYEYDSETDDISEESNLKVSVDLDFDPSVARWVSPGANLMPSVSKNGEYTETTIPALREWGFLVFAESAEAIESPGDMGSASTRFEAADNEIQRAVDEDREHGLTGAQVALRESRLALDHGAYEQAENAARRASSIAEASKRTLRVGIDQAHNQPDSEMGIEQFETAMKLFASYEYSEVTQWDEQTLSDIDLMVIPPVLSSSSNQYEFTSGDLDIIERFVEAGGGLLILGAGGVVPEINDLAELFGLGFDGGMIAYDEDELPEFHDDAFDTNGMADLSVEPEGRQLWTIRFGTPLDETGDAEVHGWVAEDSGALVNKSGRATVRNNGDLPARNKPILATVNHGSGVVSAVGTDRLFRAPLYDRLGISNWEVLLDTLMRIESAVREGHQSSPTESTRTAQSDKLTSSPIRTDVKTSTGTIETERTTANTPGFGILTGLAGIASSIAIWKRYWNTNEES